MPIIYLSPSTQDWNPYVTGSGSEEYWMNRIADAMEPYLRANGIRYRRNDPDTSAAAAIREANSGYYDFYLALLLLCKQAAKNFHTICKKETALKRVLSNLLSAVSLLRFKAVFSCGFRVPPGSGLYQSCAAGSVCIPADQKYCSPRPRKSCPADRKTPGLPSRCIGHRW